MAQCPATKMSCDRSNASPRVDSACGGGCCSSSAAATDAIEASPSASSSASTAFASATEAPSFSFLARGPKTRTVIWRRTSEQSASG